MRVGALTESASYLRMSALALVLATLTLIGCNRGREQVSPDPPAPATETIEEFWPNGELRLQKQVMRTADGALVVHGAYERWHDNGEKEYEAVFLQGKKEGTETRYHKNGRKWAEREFRDGKRHGPSISWNESGEKVKEENWADGKPHGAWTVWKSGKVKWSHTYDRGAPAP